MTLKHQYSLLLTICCVLCQTPLFGQDLFAVEVAKEKKAIYQNILNQNKTIVAFIENTLIRNGLPRMMRNLALIESGFDKNIVSAAKAAGIWQFMEEHAAEYGLKSEDRFDIYRSTQTAIQSLKHLYSKYGNWITVVAAYHCGEGNIKKAMEKANSDKYERFYSHLPPETIHHVYKFTEACQVTNELDVLLADYKLAAFKTEIETKAKDVHKNNPELASILINAAYNLDVIAQEMEIERADLLNWNPDIDKQLLTEGVAELYLPIDKMPDFVLLKNTILNRSLQITAHYDE